MAKHQVMSDTDLSIGQLKVVKAGDEKLLVYRLEDGFFATQSRCTHLFKSMEKGKIVDGCKVQCPLHRAQFNIRTGEVEAWANFPPGVQVLNFVRGEKALKTYPVTVEMGRYRLKYPDVI